MSKPVRETMKSHLNFVVVDTKVWEQAAAHLLDFYPNVSALVKNAGLGFAISYLHNGEAHDYVTDFLLRFTDCSDFTLILRTKGCDPLRNVKLQATLRWVKAVNTDDTYEI